MPPSVAIRRSNAPDLRQFEDGEILHRGVDGGMQEQAIRKVKIRNEFGRGWLGLVLLIGGATAASAQGAPDHLEINSDQSFINVEVHVPLQNFRSHLASYVAEVGLSGDGNISDVALSFRFADLHSGNGVRDAHMMAWLGGVEATGAFILESMTRAADGTETRAGTAGDSRSEAARQISGRNRPTWPRLLDFRRGAFRLPPMGVAVALSRGRTGGSSAHREVQARGHCAVTRCLISFGTVLLRFGAQGTEFEFQSGGLLALSVAENGPAR